MVRKLLQKECSNALLTLALLLAPNAIIAMEENSKEKNIRIKYGETSKTLDSGYNFAPELAQNIVDQLKNPEFLNFKRYSFFFGPPGTGKSLTARAIAYKAGWELLWLSAADFLEKGRNETARNLRDSLWKVVDDDNETIIVIDELNLLLENTNSENHDTNFSAMTLWTFLDKQRENKKFYLIGTMNRIEKMATAIKSRIRRRCIKFDLHRDSKSQKNMLLSILSDLKVKYSENCEEYLDQHIDEFKCDYWRDLEETAYLIIDIARSHKENNALIIVVADLKKSLEYFKEIDAIIDYDRVEETDEERQERYHEESIELQKKHHKESIDKQKEYHLESHNLQLQSLDKQQTNHEASLNLQRESLNKQNENHRESIQLQTTNQTNSIDQQTRQHNDTIGMQERHFVQQHVLTYVNKMYEQADKERIGISLGPVSIYKKFAPEYFSFIKPYLTLSQREHVVKYETDNSENRKIQENGSKKTEVSKTENVSNQKPVETKVNLINEKKEKKGEGGGCVIL